MSKKSEKKKSNQQKPKSATVKTVNQPKQEPAKPPEPAAETNTAANLCDDCAYEFGECEGIPKFASEADPTLKGTEADRVVECKAFRNVQDMPTAADQGPAEEPAAEEPDKPELVAAEPIPGATEEESAADVAVMEADLDERRRKIQRFQREEDFGKCPACDRPLKRTAFNRDRDAVRCTNPRCRQYRAVVRQIKAE